MKNFFQYLFASCLGTMLALFFLTIFSVWVSLRVASSLEKTEKVKPNTVLSLTLNEALPEHTNNVPVNPYEASLNPEDVVGLQDMLEMIELAKEDDNVKGIYLELGNPAIGLAKLSALREALSDFRESGKFVLSYGMYYSQAGYYLASASDQVYLNPMGGMNLSGFGAQLMFFKNMLDKLGIKAQVFYAGKFKSATEPFRRTDMSEENRLQVKQYLEENYDYFLEGIARSRGLTVDELKRIANELELREAQDAVRLNLADGLMYKDEVIEEIKDRIGLAKKDKITTMNIGDYYAAKGSTTNFKAKDKIAVVYAEGSIIDGEGNLGSIGGDNYARIIRKIRQDDKVKALVLRVNSGGGSVWASENIWREMSLAKAQGIQTVVSMGDVAASGGYYIACNSDKIYAEPNTITGSIGVFGMLPNMREFMGEKIGITFDTVKTATYATMGSPFFDLSENEAAIIQESIDTIYQRFLVRVADGRDMTVSEVNEVAQGRVWTGTQAKKLGLIDELGGLEDAIADAADLSGLDEYRLVEYPKVKDPLTQLLEELTGKDNNFAEAVIKEQMGDPVYRYFQYVKEVKEMSGPQMRMPFVLEIQ